MSDDKKLTGKQDDMRVDVKDPSEVEYLHQQFPWKTHEEIREAIKTKGPFRENIEAFLSKANKGKA